MCQKGMGTLGSIIDLFAAEAASGMAWFLSLKEKKTDYWNKSNYFIGRKLYTL